MKIHGLTIEVCEGATPVGVCDVHEVHEEDVSEEDVREVCKDVREVPQNIEIRVTAATLSPIEGVRGGCRQFDDQREPLQLVLVMLMR